VAIAPKGAMAEDWRLIFEENGRGQATSQWAFGFFIINFIKNKKK
jgi:hypothetical protein